MERMAVGRVGSLVFFLSVQEVKTGNMGGVEWKILFDGASWSVGCREDCNAMLGVYARLWDHTLLNTECGYRDAHSIFLSLTQC